MIFKYKIQNRSNKEFGEAIKNISKLTREGKSLMEWDSYIFYLIFNHEKKTIANVYVKL